MAVSALLCTAALAFSQRLTWYERLILLPNPYAIEGVVVDPEGNPIAGAHVDHSDVRDQELLFTDEEGRFRIETRAPAIVVRKLGFNGQLIRTDKPKQLRIVLHPSGTLPLCKTACHGLKSPYSVLCFADMPGVEVSDQATFGTSVSRRFLLSTHDGLREVLFGSGPSWTVGIPFSSDVWESSEYSERDFTVDDSQVVDAHGKSADGKMWRYLGRYGESAAYYELDPRDVALPDRLLDSVCVMDRSGKR